MEALLALFRFLVPYFSAVPNEDVSKALEMAAPYRPACLTPAQQDEAQVFYAAWLLYQRQLQTNAAANHDPTIFGLKSEREGDVSRTYGAVDGQSDPFDWWGKFSALYNLCGGGAITVGHRRGPGCCQH